jgi:fructoselysine-6-P-deglycase FrlB-like protein
MDPVGLLSDIEHTPETLVELAGALWRDELPVRAVPPMPSVLLLGMGSSAYASGVVAARLRAAGLRAAADLASTDLLPPPAADLLVVAVSASGASPETVEAATRYAGTGRLVAVTERPDSLLAGLADVVLPLMAGPESGGVACRSYRHTLAVLLALADQLAPGAAPGVVAACGRAADATAELLDRRREWLPRTAEQLAGPDGVWVVAPAGRVASAHQSALMLREGPRVPAVGCETGDWSHVDVYLTKTLDYRMLLLPGSRHEPALLRWTSERGATVVRWAEYDDQDVALLTETTAAELVAHTWWAAQ